MKILIDADGCPVVKQATQIAKENNIEVSEEEVEEEGKN